MAALRTIRRASSRASCVPSADEALFYVADEVGRAFVESTGARGQRVDEIACAAFLIGEHLFEIGQAGNWHAIAGGMLGASLMQHSPGVRRSLVGSLAELLPWLAESGNMHIEVVRRVLADMANAIAACPRSRATLVFALGRVGGTTGEPSIPGW